MPCGSLIKKNTIRAPTRIICENSAMSVGIPRTPTKTFLNKTGSNTINAAPINDPKIEPKPPIIIINKTSKDWSIEKASVGSAAPNQTEKYRAPATPTKKLEIAKADILATRGFTPIISAAMSISLIAIQLLPMRPRTKFRAIHANKNKKPKQNKYVAHGLVYGPVTTSPKKSL